ncbi:hypothetical protein RNZ50_25170 [Paracoccaceae bacterium Fryx2]|nr:hypothetical protein [Paracoccaceae bacterium Fryx2]
MWFDLTLEARDGSRHTMRYNPHTSEAEGLPLPVDPGIFAPAPRVACVFRLMVGIDFTGSWAVISREAGH